MISPLTQFLFGKCCEKFTARKKEKNAEAVKETPPEPQEYTEEVTVEQNNLPILLYQQPNENIHMRHSVESVNSYTPAQIINGLIMAAVNNTGMNDYLSDEKKFLRYDIKTDKTVITTYIIDSPGIHKLVSLSPLLQVAVSINHIKIPAICILSYYWWKNKNASMARINDFVSQANLYVKSYIQTFNCIHCNDYNVRYEDDVKNNIGRLKLKIHNELGDSIEYISDMIPYINDFMAAYTKATSVYIRTRVSRYGEIIGIVENTLNPFNMDMETYAAICMYSLISEDRPDSLVINNDSILKLFADTISLMFSAIL